MKALVALGSNLGNPQKKIHEAFSALEALSQGDFRKSSIWKSAPVDCPAGSPPFLNAAASFLVGSEFHPEEWLQCLLDLELKLGRTRSGTINEPRIIDLDLISFGHQICQSAFLTLPHPKVHLRRFVLAPLEEIEPDYLLPGSDQSIRLLLNQLEDDQKCERTDL